MRNISVVAPALLLAGAAVAQRAGRQDASDPAAKVPPVEFRSSFDGYRPFAEQDLRDWRKANEEVGAAAGHAGHRPAAGKEAAKPHPKPESSGHGSHK